MNSRQMILLSLVWVIWPSQFAVAEVSIQPTRNVSAAEAHQGVAVDATSYYAIASQSIARYDKSSTKRLAHWQAPPQSGIKHLNSGLVVDGRLYCANSHWPAKPLNNTIEIFAADTLQHLASKPFTQSPGAINWIDRHDGFWWIVFAFYGDAEAQLTKLVRYDDDWNESGEWTFPEIVVERFLPNSNSGGAFGSDGCLYVTGHDHAELYVLDVPAESGELKYVATLPAPIAGQGIAWDRNDPGVLLGIDRSRREVVFMRVSTTR